MGDLFLGAFFPGLMLGAMYVAYVLGRCLRQPVERAAARANLPKITPGVIWDVIKAVIPTAALILAVLGSIFAASPPRPKPRAWARLAR